jgi:hypothetical protein
MNKKIWLFKVMVPIAVALIGVPNIFPTLIPDNKMPINITIVDDKTLQSVSDAEITIQDSSSIHLNERSDTNGVAMIPKQDLKPPIKISIKKNGYAPYSAFISSQNDSKLKDIRLHKLPTKNSNVDTWTKINEIGQDKNGRTAEFTFHTLIGSAQVYGWKFASDSKIDIDDGKMKHFESASEFLEVKLANLEIDRNAELIVVGNASCEGNSLEEGLRAKSRAKTMTNSIKSIFQNNTYQLILGKYQDSQCSGKNPEKTFPQRSVIFIALTNKDINLNIEEATKNAFEKATKDLRFKSSIYGYSESGSKNTLVRSININKYTCFSLDSSPTDCK